MKQPIWQLSTNPEEIGIAWVVIFEIIMAIGLIYIATHIPK